MPWASNQQRKWGNSSSGLKALGGAKVAEFNQASKGRKLPRVAARKMKMVPLKSLMRMK